MQLGAKYLSQQAEVMWQFYVSSLKHAWHFMENSAKAVVTDD